MSKDKKPYLCSVCGPTWESASKRVPRHRCKGEFEGKVGTGIPAEGHPDYEAPVIEEKPIAGDIVFSVPEGMEEDDSEPMPIAIPKEEKKKPPSFEMQTAESGTTSVALPPKIEKLETPK